MKKVLSIVAIAMMLVFTASNFVLALDPGTLTGDTTVDTTGIQNIGKAVIQTLQTVGSVAAVIVLIVLGIKYMMGSTEEKAEYKKTMIPYVIGAVLIFAASSVAGFVYDWARTF